MRGQTQIDQNHGDGEFDSQIKGMGYQRSMQHPEALRDALLPQVRTLAQPLVMVIPMLYAGMLQGGVPAFDGLIVILLLIAASFVANILAGVIALLMLRKEKVQNR